MTVANAFTDPRTKVLAPPKSRRRCHCGCNRRATHMGQANGVTMVMGCELSIARWVQSPFKHRVAQIRVAQRGNYREADT